MSRLFGHLHQYSRTLLLACLLILGQVLFELQLPGLMSSLINTGIQSRGIEHAAPELIRPEDAGFVGEYMTEVQQQLLSSSYLASSDGVLSRAPLPEETLELLDRAFVVAEWTILELLPEDAPVGNARHSTSQSDLSDVDLAAVRRIAPGADTVDPGMLQMARERAESIPEQLAAQTGAAFAAAFYAGAGGDLATLEARYMTRTGGWMALCAATASVFAFLASRAAAQTGAGVAKNLRRALFRRVQEFSRTDYAHFTHASLIARTTTDITLVQNAAIAAIRIMVLAFFMGIGGILLAFFSGGLLGWVLLGSIAVMSAALLLIHHITKPRYRIVQNMIDRLNAVTEEEIAGAASIRIYGGEHREEERYDDANDHLAVTQLGINRVLIFLSPVFSLAINLAGLLIMWLGADAVQNARIEIGNIVADIQYTGIVLTSFVLIAGMFVILPRASVAMERIGAVLDWPEPETAEQHSALVEDPVLACEKVSFRHPKAPMPTLEEVSLAVRPGELAAIVGRTGSGKTTLMDLLAGSLKPDNGTIRLNGQNLDSIGGADLSACLAFLPQERELLQNHGETDVKELGLEILSRSADIHLLDDPFLGIPPAAHGSVWKALRRAASSGSTLIAASRVSHVKKADCIHMLENGRIIASGTHAQLLKSCPSYLDLFKAEGGSI